MKGTRRGKTDAMERQIERALRPGEFIYDRACFSFVSGLGQVANGIKELIPAEPSRAVALCEVFLAGCHAKAEQLDDSSGNFGDPCQGSHLPLDQSAAYRWRQAG